MRVLLHALKFGGRERLGYILGSVAASRWVKPGVYDAIVPVPLSRRRRRRRGFNQAECVAMGVAHRGAASVRIEILRKPRDCPPQTGLSAAARRSNVAAVYRASLPPPLRGASLLLVDDVLTTGATVESAARALRRAGAGAVDVLTVARVP